MDDMEVHISHSEQWGASMNCFDVSGHTKTRMVLEDLLELGNKV